MASPAFRLHSMQQGNDAEGDEDEWVARIRRGGCFPEHEAMQDCYYEHRDWRKCTTEMRAFRTCFNRVRAMRNAAANANTLSNITTTQGTTPSKMEGETHGTSSKRNVPTAATTENATSTTTTSIPPSNTPHTSNAP